MYFENRGQGTFLVGELTFIKNVGFRKDLNGRLKVIIKKS